MQIRSLLEVINKTLTSFLMFTFFRDIEFQSISTVCALLHKLIPPNVSIQSTKIFSDFSFNFHITGVFATWMYICAMCSNGLDETDWTLVQAIFLKQKKMNMVFSITEFYAHGRPRNEDEDWFLAGDFSLSLFLSLSVIKYYWNCETI